jgi:drug/metabolite transporter (DMT)-like permease
LRLRPKLVFRTGIAGKKIMTPQAATASRSTIPAQGVIAIIIGVIAVALAAIFIRFAQAEAVPSLVIAAGRLTIAALILSPYVWLTHRTEILALRRRDLLLALLSGAVLAVHFATWIASLEYTTVLISVVLVSSSPLWVAALERVFLRVRLNRWVGIGLMVAIAGGMLIGIGGDSGAEAGSNPLLGGVLALAGAVAVAVYFVVGRDLRARLSLLPYIWLVYSCAAIFLLAAVLVAGVPIVGYSANAYLWIVALALVPQLIGHSAFNFALRYLSATYVSIITQTEPIASAIAAFIIFREQPLPLQLLGSLGILIGVVLASLGQRKT